jgi:hypothetical protein
MIVKPCFEPNHYLSLHALSCFLPQASLWLGSNEQPVWSPNLELGYLKVFEKLV